MMKKNGDKPISKRALMEQTDLYSYSVQKWRSLQSYKRLFTNQFLKMLHELEEFVSILTKSISMDNSISTCSYSYIF
jgi:hypothetical protein